MSAQWSGWSASSGLELFKDTFKQSGNTSPLGAQMECVLNKSTNAEATDTAGIEETRAFRVDQIEAVDGGLELDHDGVPAQRVPTVQPNTFSHRIPVVNISSIGDALSQDIHVSGYFPPSKSGPSKTSNVTGQNPRRPRWPSRNPSRATEIFRDSMTGRSARRTRVNTKLAC
ncbi:hypothetical protein B0H19DRAFT_1074565 [Mycena capillaripes]|nr:hypothetical protein B0H19DRAFT_1074565 [Mycena capillaripes]